MVHLGRVHPRTETSARLGRHRPRRRGERPRRVEDRQGGRRPRRPPVGPGHRTGQHHGRQALPERRPPPVPPRRRLPRGPPGAQVARDARDGPPHRVRQAGHRRPVGRRRVRRARSAVGARPPGALPGAARRVRDADVVHRGPRGRGAYCRTAAHLDQARSRSSRGPLRSASLRHAHPRAPRVGSR